MEKARTRGEGSAPWRCRRWHGRELSDDQSSLVQAGVSERRKQSGGGEEGDDLFHVRWSLEARVCARAYEMRRTRISDAGLVKNFARLNCRFAVTLRIAKEKDADLFGSAS